MPKPPTNCKPTYTVTRTFTATDTGCNTTSSTQIVIQDTTSA